MRDLHSSINVSPAIDPAVITTGNATLTSNVIDCAGYESLEFVFVSGAITDSTFTITLYEDDDIAMGTEQAVSAADLLGTAPTFIYNSGGDSATKRVGYRGNKRYVRAKAVQTGASTGGYLCAIAVQGHPHTAPVA